MTLEEAKKVITHLWVILDRIDTYADLCINGHSYDDMFGHIENLAKERHKYIQTDGTDLYFNNEEKL